MDLPFIKRIQKQKDGKLMVDLPGPRPLNMTTIDQTLRRIHSEPCLSHTNFDHFEIAKLGFEATFTDIKASSSIETLMSTVSSASDLDETDLEPSSSESTRFSSSLSDLRENSRPNTLSRSGSLLDISPLNRGDGYLSTFQGCEHFTECMRIYVNYVEALRKEEYFLNSIVLFEEKYPNYWNHLLSKCTVFMSLDVILKEETAHLEFIETSKSLMKKSVEEAIENGRIPPQVFEFEGADIFADFSRASCYLRKHDPMLFAYLIVKHNLRGLIKKKKHLEKTRDKILSLMDNQADKLMEREKQLTPQ